MERTLVKEKEVVLRNVEGIYLVPKHDFDNLYFSGTIRVRDGAPKDVELISRVLVKRAPVYRISIARGDAVVDFEDDEPNVCVLEKDWGAYVIKCAKTEEEARYLW
ncbi:hypothetical protein DRN63_05290 [Nanoarchaeota archaeon]|nr:MAG: hypothetical protein DRN63_05290 [Nanoarchaeota archaeon]